MLLSGGDALARETWILDDLRSRPSDAPAAMLEGLPSGRSGLDDFPALQVRRSAPGCLCCTGNLVLRVTLNRLLREQPSRLYIAVTPGTHIDQLATMLSAMPYSEWLDLEQKISL